jgi:hypothetical protein
MQCWPYDWSNCINSALGVCPSCQNMTSMFIDVFSHNQETLIIRWHMSWLARGNQGPICLYATRVLMFPLNTIIAWDIILWTNEIWHKNTLYYLHLGHISFMRGPWDDEEHHRCRFSFRPTKIVFSIFGMLKSVFCETAIETTFWKLCTTSHINNRIPMIRI